MAVKKGTFLLSILFTLCTAPALKSQTLKTEVFSLLDLERPGLERVNALHKIGEDREAAEVLLKYFRTRMDVKHPEINLSDVTISEEEQRWADDALEHTFFVHKGYQPSYNYGKDINWQYWPVQDNELRWQLHRHKWFTPMGKAYRISGDEKYAEEWARQYMDWIAKNPLAPMSKSEYEMVSSGEVKGKAENVRFAWRPLEVSNRLQDQTNQFMYFIASPHFTPEFLTEFLVNYHRHALHILSNYSDKGNHLLFEAQRIIYAGAFFPEFKEAAAWRKSGIDILNRQINVQVYEDGGQFELDPHYHLAAINIFCKALYMAEANGFIDEFPQSYIDTIEKMIVFYYNICFPDYSNPCFSDAKLGSRKDEIKNYCNWMRLYPDNEQIRFFATKGKEGRKPDNLSMAAKASGFFTFRNSWDTGATVMVLKAGPQAFWHCQPDNGTFELWFNGKNLFPDSGAYVYAGDEEVMKLRNWFRQTRVHNTLTLENKNLENTASVTKLWKNEGDIQVLVTENPSYEDLTHRRAVFFVEQAYFVIVDEAYGKATGNVNLHYQFAEGSVDFNPKHQIVNTKYEGNSNVILKCFADQPLDMQEEEGWCSVAYRQRMERPAYSFNYKKSRANAARFITIIYPTKNGYSPRLSARFNHKQFQASTVDVQVSVDGKKHRLKADF